MRSLCVIWFFLWLAGVVIFFSYPEWEWVQQIEGWRGLWAFGGAFLGAILLVAATCVYIWRDLAPNNKYFTFVEEGTAKAIMKGDKFERFEMAWAGREFKINVYGEQDNEVENWEIVEGKKKKSQWSFSLPGGLRWIGLLGSVYGYDFEWTHMHQSGETKDHKETLYYILLKKDAYVIEYPLESGEGQSKIGPAEDVDGLKLGVKMVVPMSIANPYAALFEGEKFLTLVTAAGKPTLRAFLASYRYKEDLLNMRAGKGIEDVQERSGKPNVVKQGTDLRDDLWQEFTKRLKIKAEAEGKIAGMRKGGFLVAGALIEKEGIDIIDIDPGEEYRALTTLAYKAEKEKEAAVIKADQDLEVSERKGKIKGKEAGGAFAETKSQLTGAGVPPEKVDEAALDLTKYWKGTETGTRRDIHFGGAESEPLLTEMAKIMAAKKNLDEDAKPKKGKKQQKPRSDESDLGEEEIPEDEEDEE